jgi:hypothetical protein
MCTLKKNINLGMYFAKFFSTSSQVQVQVQEVTEVINNQTPSTDKGRGKTKPRPATKGQIKKQINKIIQQLEKLRELQAK